MQVSGSPARTRDIRLDFFRGLAMLIIVIAHVPSNPWNNWIPARFGFSSGAEMFVFCSGMASALAFGSVFVRQGLGLGTARIAQRIWQLYWAQIAVFMVTVALSVWATQTLGAGNYIAGLYLEWFLARPDEALPALLTLRYIPNFFDMLPMYMLLLGAVPLVMLLARVGRGLVLAVCLGLWLFVQVTGFNLPARPNSDLVWYFNPLAWQLLFFTGFALGMGWLKAPRRDNPRLIRLAAAIAIVSVPLSFWGFHHLFPALGELHDRLLGDASPTNLHVLRLVHFAAIAYLAVGLVERWQEKIAASRLLQPVIRVGQQTFAVFLVSVPLAWSMGMLLDVFGRGPAVLALANLGGIAIALLIARTVHWFKSQPWRRKHGPETAAAAHPVRPPAQELPAQELPVQDIPKPETGMAPGLRPGAALAVAERVP